MLSDSLLLLEANPVIGLLRIGMAMVAPANHWETLIEWDVGFRCTRRMRDDMSTDDATLPRKQAIARRIARAAYPFQCCVVCGLQVPTCLTIAHLDHNAGNNDSDNLAVLCQTHHWMFDCGFYPVEAIRLLRAHWQVTKGVPSH